MDDDAKHNGDRGNHESNENVSEHRLPFLRIERKLIVLKFAQGLPSGRHRNQRHGEPGRSSSSTRCTSASSASIAPLGPGTSGWLGSGSGGSIGVGSPGIVMGMTYPASRDRNAFARLSEHRCDCRLSRNLVDGFGHESLKLPDIRRADLLEKHFADDRADLEQYDVRSHLDALVRERKSEGSRSSSTTTRFLLLEGRRMVGLRYRRNCERRR